MLENDPIISKVLPHSVQRPDRGLMTDRYANLPLNVDIPVEKDSPVYELTLWTKIRLLPSLLTIVWGVYMQDLKTTVSGIVKAAFLLLTVFGIHTGGLTEAAITGFIYAGLEIYQSFNTADKKS